MSILVASWGCVTSLAQGADFASSVPNDCDVANRTNGRAVRNSYLCNKAAKLIFAEEPNFCLVPEPKARVDNEY